LNSLHYCCPTHSLTHSLTYCYAPAETVYERLQCECGEQIVSNTDSLTHSLTHSTHSSQQSVSSYDFPFQKQK
jgi:hypothetical protein